MKTSTKALFWAARILCILAILFISLFTLDSFASDQTFWQNTAAFLMHLIPSFVLLAILIIAWKWELIGGVIFILAFIAGTIFFNSFSGNWGSLIVISPFLITGILFIADYRVNKKKAVI